MAGKVGTYSNNPAGSSIDAVRFHVGDTDCANLRLSDEEVQYLIDQAPTDLEASVLAAEFLAAHFAQQRDITTGRVSKSNSQIFEHYKRMAANLRVLAQNGGLTTGAAGVPVVAFRNTGERRDADRTDRTDSDLKQPNFEIAGADNRRADSQPRGGKGVKSGPLHP